MKHKKILLSFFIIFFFNDTATTEIYTLSLHDALPILVDQNQSDVHESEQGGETAERQRQSGSSNEEE